MGLDNYFTFRCSPGETAPPVEIKTGTTLYGGMLSSSDDCSAFRGKLYAPIVEELTEFDLYAYEIEPCDCIRLGEQLLYATKDKLGSDTICARTELTINEVRDLGHVFIAYGDAGYSCTSWY